MWAEMHKLDPRHIWALPFWVGVLGLFSLLFVPENWRFLSWSIFALAFAVLIVSLLLVAPYKVWKKDIDELSPLKRLKDDQVGNEGDWLHLVVEDIDLEKRLDFSEREISIKFQIDSGLTYDFQPYRLWVSPIIGGYEPEERQYEMIPPPNFLKGRRSQLASIRMIIKDDRLLELVNNIRQGSHMNKGLKIEMQLEDGKSPVVFRSY